MRTAGVVTWIVLLAVLGASVVAPRGGASPPDVVGTVQLYGDGTLVIETSTAGPREVRIDPSTLVRDPGGPPGSRDDRGPRTPVTLGDLRPGRTVAVWYRTGLDPRAVAGAIDVWGKGR
jgi:hypothetical protein